MIVSIHQPEHFPYLGFFQKMQKSDLFVILDDVKFKKNNFQNRNKLLTSDGEEQWFTIPVEKKANSKLIKDVKVAEDNGWRKKLLKQLHHNFGINEWYMEQIYSGDSLMDINMRTIDYCRELLMIDTPMKFSLELKVEGTKTELLFNICKEVGAKTYLSGQGGIDYLDKDVFKDINVEVFEPDVEDYYTTLNYIMRNKPK